MVSCVFVVLLRRPPKLACTETLFPNTTRFRSARAARIAASFVFGGGAADRARLDGGVRHFRAGNRLAVGAGDLATDTGGCALRESGRGGECGDQPKRQLGKSETGMVHVCLASIRLTIVADRKSTRLNSSH